MRIRSMIITAVASASTFALLAGCSGRPENSPVVRKKFAEVDENTKSVETLKSEVAALSEQVRRLTEENSELRAFLPDVDGQNAVSKLTQLESQIKSLESMAANGAVTNLTTTAQAPAPVAPASTTTTGSAPASADIETAPLAGAAPAPAMVASQQEVAAAKPAEPVRSTFKEMTKPKAATTTAAKTTTAKPAATKTTEKKAPAAAAPAKSRGSYHTIEATETVSQIASKYGVSAEEILKANRLPAGARLARGQRLYIPAK